MTPPRIAFVGPPFPGHLNPLLFFARRFQADGHPVSVISAGTARAVVEGAGLPFREVVRDDPRALARIVDTPHPVRSNPLRLAQQLRANLALLPAIRQELAVHFDREPPAAVVADFCAPVVAAECSLRSIPWLTTIPSPFALENRRGTPSYLGGLAPPRHALDRLRDAAGRRLVRFSKRALAALFARQLRRAGLALYRPDGSEGTYSPQSILGLGMTELELERDWPAAFRMIGPVTESPEASEPPLELPPAPRVLVTLGSHLPWARADLLDRLERLAASFRDHAFVVSRGRIEEAAAAPERNVRNLWVYSYVSYDRQLSRFAAVIHHGGAGITYSAIRAARPSLVWPQDYDQFDYAARIAARGLGVRVRRIDSAAAVADLGRILHQPDRRALTEMAAAAARYDPFESCRAEISRLTAERPGGSPRSSGGPAAV